MDTRHGSPESTGNVPNCRRMTPAIVENKEKKTRKVSDEETL